MFVLSLVSYLVSSLLIFLTSLVLAWIYMFGPGWEVVSRCLGYFSSDISLFFFLLLTMWM